MHYKNNSTVMDWRKRHPILIKTVTLFLFIAFLSYDITWAQSGTPIWQNAKPVDTGATNGKNNINGIAIPTDTGKIDSVYSNEAGQTIINIQDAHASLGAQKSIVKILDHLATNYNLNFIAVEGSEGYVDTSILRSCPNSEIKKKTADYLMRQGRMSAGEFFTVMSEKSIAFYGIEDNRLYKENVELFKSVMEDKVACNKHIDALEATLNKLEDKIYNKGLGEFVRQSRSHKKGVLNFSLYWEYITTLANEIDIEIKGYGNITRLLSAIRLEKEINFEKANQERKALIDQLSKKIDKETLEKVVLKSIAFKKGEINNVEFHNYLIDLAEKTELEPVPYKNLINFTKYIAVYETVDIFNLYSELDALEGSMVEKLYTSQDERSLYDLQRKARTLKGLFNISLTNNDADYLLQHKNEFKADEIANFIKKNYLKYKLVIEGGYDLGYIVGKLDDAIEFYKIAHQRNDAMLRNTIENMKREGQNVAALITGGFHTRGLANLIKDKKLSYLVIMPKFKHGEDRPYIAILTNKKEPYEELLKTGQYQLGVYQYFSRGDISDLAVSVAIPLIERMRELKDEPTDTIKAELSKLVAAWKRSYGEAYKISAHRESRLSAKRLSPGIFNAMINLLFAEVSRGEFNEPSYSALTTNPEFKKITDGVEYAKALQDTRNKEASELVPVQSSAIPQPSEKAPKEKDEKMQLHKELTLGNHIFMSIHSAFMFPYYIDRILHDLGIHTAFALTPETFAVEAIVGTVFAIITAWIAIGWHERGHYMQSVRQLTLNEKLLPAAQEKMKGSFFQKLLWNAELMLKAPAGKFPGIKRAGLSYYVDAPFNLSAAAEGQRASRNMSIASFPLAAVLITAGFLTGIPLLSYIGRVFLGLSILGLIDFKFADADSYKKFQAQGGKGTKHTQNKTAKGDWLDKAPEIKKMMERTRIQEMTLPDGTVVKAPWGFRNSGMGGRHTEKEYPESNLSMQEAMFIPLNAKNYEEAQRMTVDLQTKLMQIINKTEGCRVMGIGLEGGLATYITKNETDIVPEQKLWRLMKKAIEDLGYNKDGKIDVAIAFDPAASELENNYREEYHQPDAVGTYLFWRSKEKVVMSREELLELYKTALNEGIPIVSIEDGFAEDDDAGWALIMEELGDKIFVIGDDFITTNDATIEKKTEWVAPDGTKKKLMNASLIKANQIGTLTETILAMLTSLGKSAELVVSHRSKSPNDDMEAQIALAAMAVGLKAGGGANTERLVKYGSIIKLFKDLQDEVRRNIAEENNIKPSDVSEADIEKVFSGLEITSVTAYEESTNAGVPTVGVKVTAGIRGSKRSEKLLSFTGSTPLGTSAGTGEASHLVDSIIEKCELTQKYSDLFKEGIGLTYTFKKDVKEKDITAKNDPALSALWQKANRYGGKGCLNAVSNVEEILSKLFVGKKVSELKSVNNIDNMLLNAELDLAIKRGKIAADASQEDKIKIMQYKGNLGMNAILSLSLAMSRLLGALDGKDMWRSLRDQMSETMARTILANGELTNIMDESLKLKVKQAIEDNKGKKEDWQVLVETMSFEDLVKALQQVNATRPEGTPLYELLRAQLPVYDISKINNIAPAPAATTSVPAVFATPIPATAASTPTTPADSAPFSEEARARDINTVRDAIIEQLGQAYESDIHHGLKHSEDLIKKAIVLAHEIGKEGQVAWMILAAAIYLHDISVDEVPHGKNNAVRANAILSKIGIFSESEKERICNAIELHDVRDSGPAKRREASLEAQILYDVDQWDAFGVKGIYRYIAIYSQRGTPYEEILPNAKVRYESLTFQETKRLAEIDYVVTNSFFNRLADEHRDSSLYPRATFIMKKISENSVLNPTVIAKNALRDLWGMTGSGADYDYILNFFMTLASEYGAEATPKAFASFAGDYRNWSREKFESGKFNANVATGKHFYFMDSTMDVMFNESFQLLKGLAREDPRLEKHLSEILSQYHNKAPPIEFDGQLSENSHRLGEAIIFDTRFISDLVRQYNAGNKDWARYLLAQRLLHELGHTPTTVNLSEEEELIGYDLLLYKILKAKGIQQKISDVFEKFSGDISFPSGYYFNLLEAISTLRTAEEQTRAIKVYAEHPSLSKEDIANLTDAIRHGDYEGVDARSALQGKKVIYYPGAWLDIAGIKDVVDASPAVDTVILLDRKYSFRNDERRAGLIRNFGASLQMSGFRHTLEGVDKNVITFKADYNGKDVKVKVIGGSIETDCPKEVREQPAVHIVKYMDLFGSVGNTASEFYAKTIGTMKEGDVLLVTDTRIPTLELSSRLVGLAPLIDVKGAFAGDKKWNAYKKVGSYDENTIKQVLEIDHLLTEIDRSPGKEGKREFIAQACAKIDELLKGIQSEDVKTHILSEIKLLPVHKKIESIISQPVGSKSFGPFVDKGIVILGIPETIVKSEADRSEIIEALAKINRSGAISENVEPAFFKDDGFEEDNMRRVELIAQERGAILGIPVRSNISVAALLGELNGGFLTQVSRDLFSLTNPDLNKLDETRVRFEDREKLLNALKELARLFPAIVSAKLSELSIYNMRMTAIAQKTASDQLSPDILAKITDSKEKRALSMRADTLGELKLLAEAHRARMDLARKLNRTAVPVKLQIRLMLRQDEEDKIKNITNAEMLRRMGIENVLRPEDIVRVDSESAGSVNVAVKEAYDRLLAAGYGTDKIAIVDRVKESRDDVPEGAIFVEYDDEVVTSYHYDAVLELMVAPDNTTLSIRDAGKKNWFRIKPITKVDFNQLREEIKRYEKVLIAA